MGTLRPLTKSLDAWLQEGTLSDPSGEVMSGEGLDELIAWTLIFVCV